MRPIKAFWGWLVEPSLSPLEIYAMIGAYLLIKSVGA